jgi:hypothetical protein
MQSGQRAREGSKCYLTETTSPQTLGTRNLPVRNVCLFVSLLGFLLFCLLLFVYFHPHLLSVFPPSVVSSPVFICFLLLIPVYPLSFVFLSFLFYFSVFSIVVLFFPDTQCIGGWVGPRSGLDVVERRKFLPVPELELRPLGRPARSESLYRLRYPGSTIGRYGHEKKRPCLFKNIAPGFA